MPDITGFTASIECANTRAFGLLAGHSGAGRSTVTITPGAAGGTFDAQGHFEFAQAAAMPPPGTPALALLGLLLAATARRRTTRAAQPRGTA